VLRDIIKKEILETITNAKFVFTFLLCSVLILFAILFTCDEIAGEKEMQYREEPAWSKQIHG